MSMGDLPVPEDYKREVSDFYGAHYAELREGLGGAAASAGASSAASAAAEEGAAAAAAAASAAASASPDAPPSALSALGLAVAREELRGGAGALLPASGASAMLPEYRSLDWRLEVEVSRRCVHSVMEPNFMLQLGVVGLGPEGAAGGGSGRSSSGSGSAASLAAAGPHALAFSADFQGLKRAAASLSTASLERSKAHVKRVYKI